MTRIAPTTADFRALIPDEGALIGIDHGRKRIGVAVSDFRRQMAAPLTTVSIKTFQERVRTLLRISSERQAVGIVIGLPLRLDGTEGKQCQSVRAFAHNLISFSALPIMLWDERLTSFEADARMTKIGLSKRKRQTSIDQIAASIILQEALHAINKNEAATV